MPLKKSMRSAPKHAGHICKPNRIEWYLLMTRSRKRAMKRTRTFGNEKQHNDLQKATCET